MGIEKSKRISPGIKVGQDSFPLRRTGGVSVFIAGRDRFRLDPSDREIELLALSQRCRKVTVDRKQSKREKGTNYFEVATNINH